MVIGIDNFDSFYDRGIKESNIEVARKQAAYTFIEGCITDAAIYDAVPSLPDLVIHLAAKAGVLPSLKNPQSYSFISGHATTSTFFSVFVILLLKDKYKYIYFILFWPLLFAYSRLYLGVHFPIDILVGILIGIVFANIYYFLFKKLDAKFFT